MLAGSKRYEISNVNDPTVLRPFGCNIFQRYPLLVKLFKERVEILPSMVKLNLRLPHES